MLPKTLKLNNGRSIPTLGLGTWRAEKGMVQIALQTARAVGYRHFDCAFIYDNEPEIGNILREVADRESIFVTSKLWNDKHCEVMKACDNTLKDLQLNYLDLYLIHWPITQDPVTKMNRVDMDQLKKTWKEMETLVECGKAKSIGVSNFTVGLLKELLPSCKIKPAVNQVELHPYLPQQDLVDFCKENGIIVTAYSPLGSRPGQSSVLDDPVIVQVAERNRKTPAQVLISWAIQRGTVVIPKSSNPDRIKSNFEVFELSEEDLVLISTLQAKNKRYVDPKSWAQVDLFGSH